VRLDSAVELDRADAQRLYLHAGFAIAAHHFARGASADPGDRPEQAVGEPPAGL